MLSAPTLSCEHASMRMPDIGSHLLRSGTYFMRLHARGSKGSRLIVASDRLQQHVLPSQVGEVRSTLRCVENGRSTSNPIKVVWTSPTALDANHLASEVHEDIYVP